MQPDSPNDEGRENCAPRRTLEIFATKWTSMILHLLHARMGGCARTAPCAAASARFEHDLLIERTIARRSVCEAVGRPTAGGAGLSRAKAEGKQLGRPASLAADQRRSVLRRMGEGAGMSALAREFKTSRQTTLRIRDVVPAS